MLYHVSKCKQEAAIGSISLFWPKPFVELTWLKNRPRTAHLGFLRARGSILRLSIPQIAQEGNGVFSGEVDSELCVLAASSGGQLQKGVLYFDIKN